MDPNKPQLSARILANSERRRFVGALIVVPVIILVILFQPMPNWLLMILYLVMALPFVFEHRMRRIVFHRSLTERDNFGLWLEKLERAPEAVANYWYSTYLMVERVAQYRFPRLWESMSELQRWFLVDLFERSAVTNFKAVEHLRGHSSTPMSELSTRPTDVAPKPDNDLDND
jgi:uncharacterized protein YhhL (DUF1145 family)